MVVLCVIIFDCDNLNKYIQYTLDGFERLKYHPPNARRFGAVIYSQWLRQSLSEAKYNHSYGV